MDAGQTEGALSPELTDNLTQFTREIGLTLAAELIGGLQEMADALNRELTYTITVKPHSDEVRLSFKGTAALNG